MLICRQIANELQIVVSRFEFRIKKNWSKWSFNFNNWKIPPVFYLYLPLLTRLKEASSCTSRHCLHENDQLTCYGGYFPFQRSVSWRTKLNRVDNITEIFYQLVLEEDSLMTESRNPNFVTNRNSPFCILLLIPRGAGFIVELWNLYFC